MKFYSTTKQAPEASFETAVRAGLAPDGGLYMPEQIPILDPALVQDSSMSLTELAFRISQPFIDGEIDDDTLQSLLNDAIDFPAPLVEISPGIFCLELFHGPTLAFKDFGARFMARMLSHFVKKNPERTTVLVATSGDTGSAVASGFLGVPNIDVVILYPTGKVSKIQELQLTTMGQNITALEVEGSFDDCQKLVKEAFGDDHLSTQLGLTSANSINIARLIPQTFYYAHAVQQLQSLGLPPVISVPSGNFGNITAGVIAQRMGFGIKHFIASTNINDIVPQYLNSGEFCPKESIQTISNAMDVGNPSNFARLLELCQGDHSTFQRTMSGCAFSDEETKAAILDVFGESGYTMDPHGAVGYLGLKTYMDFTSYKGPGVFLATAHPSKFLDVVEPIIGGTIEIPARLAAYLTREKVSIPIKPQFDILKSELNKLR
jgi:threonine synthase